MAQTMGRCQRPSIGCFGIPGRYRAASPDIPSGQPVPRQRSFPNRRTGQPRMEIAAVERVTGTT